jgi:hypothetical protein
MLQPEKNLAAVPYATERRRYSNGIGLYQNRPRELGDELIAHGQIGHVDCVFRPWRHQYVARSEFDSVSQGVFFIEVWYMNDQKNLINAISRGNASVVKRLLEHGRVRVRNLPNTNTFRGYFYQGGSWDPNGLEYPPISIAVEASIPLAEKKKIIKLLLQHGANINSRDLNGFAAIHQAIQTRRVNNNPIDDLELVRFLIQHGANVNIRSSFRGMQPLHIAAEDGKYEIARLLVEKGANVNRQNDSGYTALHYVISRGWVYGSTKLNFVRFLLNHNATPNTKIYPEVGFFARHRDMQGWTPLHTAAANGETDIVRLLLERGARRNATDAQGMTPLHRAATRGRHDAVNELLRFGAHVNVRSKNGKTPVDVAHTKNIKNMLITFPQRRLYAVGAMNKIKKHGTKNMIHVPNNIKFKILSQTDLFSFNNMGPKKNTRKRKRNSNS